ncbi:MAG: hypothetical protein ACHP7O_05160 [Burkholderiales bacterium]
MAMKTFKVTLVVLLIGAIVGSLTFLGYIHGPNEEGDGEKFSVETTSFGRLLDTPCTRKLFLTKFGAAAMVNNPQINIARHLTMRRLSTFPLARISDPKLKAMQAEFFRLDPRSPECKRPGI